MDRPAAIVIHIDFDYFFAQCEELRKPELRQKPVVVCVFSGRTADSGVVSTANYVARKYGVKSGIPIRTAKSRLDSNAVFLPLDRQYYEQVSDMAMSAIRENSDVFEQVGIDECFIDVSQKTGRDYDKARELAVSIKQQVKNVSGISCSAGVGPNKIVAKIASDMQKPDGLTLVRPEDSESFMFTLDVDRIPGIGPKSRQTLEDMGIKTCGQLARTDLFLLIEKFGSKTAGYIHNAARGLNDEPVMTSDSQNKQLMRIFTLKQDASDAAQMYGDLESLCQSIHAISKERNLAFKTVGLILISENLESITRSKTLKTHTSSLDLFLATAKSLLDEAMKTKINVRRLGVRISDFQDSSGQDSLLNYLG